MATEDRWGRRTLPTADAPAPVRLDPVPAAAPAPAPCGEPPAAGQKKYSNDYSRFQQQAGEVSDSDESEGDSIGELPDPHQLDQMKKMLSMSTRIEMPDGRQLVRVPPEGYKDGNPLPPGMTQIKDLSEFPGTPQFLARAERHFKRVERELTMQCVKEILVQLQRIGADNQTNLSFRDYLRKLWISYKHGKNGNTLSSWHPMWQCPEDKKSWANVDPYKSLVPWVIPEIYDWWWRANPSKDFDMIFEYFIDDNPTYEQFIDRCQEQFLAWREKRPADAGGIPLKVMGQHGYAPEAMAILRSWSLQRLMSLWHEQWQAGVRGQKSGIGFAAGFEQHALDAHKKKMKFKGWVDPPPGSVVSMSRTITPAWARCKTEAPHMQRWVSVDDFKAEMED